jgi:hypothetical protein
MENATFLKIFDDTLCHEIGVVTLVQRAGTGKKVNIVLSVFVSHDCALGLYEDSGEATAIGTDIGFYILKNGGIHRKSS